MSEYELPENFKATTDLAMALQGCGLILACLPAQIAPGQRQPRVHREAESRSVED